MVSPLFPFEKVYIYIMGRGAAKGCLVSHVPFVSCENIKHFLANHAVYEHYLLPFSFSI